MRTFRTILMTVLVTSGFWLGFGAWWIGRESGDAPLAEVSLPQPDNVPSTSSSERDVAMVPAPLPPRRSGGLVIPVAGVKADQLVDTFTQARAGGARRHDAIDIMAPTGTPVLAAAPGKIEKIFLSDAGGKTIYVRSRDGRRIYYYAHLDRYAPGLREGDTVALGQRLGTVGFTGNANPEGPHLHFEIMQTSPDRAWHEEKSALNPYPLLTGRAKE